MSASFAEKYPTLAYFETLERAGILSPMSPPSSAQASITRPSSKPTHSRHTSAVGLQVSKAPSPKPPPALIKPNVHYTCIIRLPFPRGDFEDPPPVEWDAAKDRALWKLVSKASNSKDLDWESIATRFDVGLPFLLQQAAWLYERHFEGMRKQMMKLGVGSQAPSPGPQEGSGTSSGTGAGVGGVAMGRQGSRDSRMPSVINTLKAQPGPASDGSSPGTPRSAHPPISRTPSTTTVTQSRVLGGSGKQPLQRTFRTSSGSQRRPPAPTRTADSAQDDEYALGHDGPSSDSDDEPPSMARSQAFRRAPLGKKPALKTLSSDGDSEDDEDDSSGGYLPFAAGSAKPAREDPTATLKGTVKRHSGAGPPAAVPGSRRPPAREQPPDSSASSATSSVANPPPSSSEDGPSSTRPGPISPRHKAQLANANLSPRSRRDGSEGSPSMGSSFSDLDDASVTQSALEDALLSNMQHGNMSIASRISGFRDMVRKQ